MLIRAKTLTIETEKKIQLFDLTPEVKSFLAEAGIWNGMGTISTLHTTTSIFFTETQEALWDDIEAFLRQVVQESAGYKHNDPRFSDCERKNATAHLQAMLLGGSLALQIEEGQLVLGKYQRIIFAELDGPRPRSIRIQCLGERVQHPATILQEWNDIHKELLGKGGLG